MFKVFLSSLKLNKITFENIKLTFKQEYSKYYLRISNIAFENNFLSKF